VNRELVGENITAELRIMHKKKIIVKKNQLGRTVTLSKPANILKG